MKKTYASGIAFVCSYVALVSLGILFAVLYKLYEAERATKENFLLEVVFKDNVSTDDAKKVFAEINAKKYCKNAVFISKDSALEIVKSEITDTNALSFLDENPLYNSVQIHLKNEFVRSSSVANIEGQLKNNQAVEAVRYSFSALHELEKTLPVIRLVALTATGVIIFFTLLTLFFVMRLTLSSEKVTIESMKLFGATHWFIAKPYIGWSFLNAVLAGILAVATIFAVGYYMNFTFTQLHLVDDLITFAQLGGALALFAIVFLPLSTALALNRYLKY